MLTKKEADKVVKKINGEIRGIAFNANCDFIFQAKGLRGIKKLETKMAELGFPFECKDIRPMDFYPMKTAVIFMLAVKEVFNFSDKKFEEIGASSVKFNLFLKIFMKYFSSLDLIASQVPNLWRKHYTIGDLEMTEYSKEKRYIILRLKDFFIHPIYCSNFKGYFTKIAEMTLKYKVKCEETKCVFRGNPYHEFLITW